MARRALSWIIFRRDDPHCYPHSHSIDLMLHALAVDTKGGTYSEDAIPDVAVVESVCGGLITVDVGSSQVRLARKYHLFLSPDEKHA